MERLVKMENDRDEFQFKIAEIKLVENWKNLAKAEVETLWTESANLIVN